MGKIVLKGLYILLTDKQQQMFSLALLMLQVVKFALQEENHQIHHLSTNDIKRYCYN